MDEITKARQNLVDAMCEVTKAARIHRVALGIQPHDQEVVSKALQEKVKAESALFEARVALQRTAKVIEIEIPLDDSKENSIRLSAL